MRLYYFLISFFITILTFRFGYSADDSAFLSSKPSAPTNFGDLACIIIALALDFIPYLVVIAVGAWMMGLIGYVGNGDNEEKRAEGRKMMIYGIVGFFFMVSIWGVLSIFTKSFGIDLAIPQLKANDASTFSCSKLP
jgi:hypothetical protein